MNCMNIRMHGATIKKVPRLPNQSETKRMSRAAHVGLMKNRAKF